jgi:hypothetical protein
MDSIKATADGYCERLAAVRERLDSYDVRVVSRCDATDGHHDAMRSIRASDAWLAGEYDGSYPGPHPSFGTTLDDFRQHYAADALRDALHHVVWAEHFAGLRT